MKNILEKSFLFFLPIIFTYVGYISINIFNWNIDIYFLHSILLVILVSFFLLSDVYLKNFKFNKYFRVFVLCFISCSLFGINIAIILENLINTTQLELGRFAINDASDYLNQSIDYLYNKKLYTEKGRVVFPILYAGFLGELKLNTTLIQIIITTMASIITFCSVMYLYKYYGYVSALIFAGLSIDFLFEHIGGTCTETIGYILGSIAFIFFLQFINLKKDKTIYFISFTFFLLLGYLVRPSYPLLIPLLLLWSYFYIRKKSFLKGYSVFLVIIVSFFSVFLSNKIIIQEKSRNSPDEFGNVYDSWYATHELGKYYLEGRYDQLPSTLWTKIIVDNPDIEKLEGNEKLKKKKEIFLKSLYSNPENYLIGSFIQIIKFFETSFVFDERYHNTGGFLHIDFVFYRGFIILIFSIVGIMSIYSFIKSKSLENILPGIIFISVLLSQPFIYGGEARTAATVIMFLNLVIILFIPKLLKFHIFNKLNNSYNYNYNKIGLNNISLNLMVFGVILFLFFFFFKGLNNSYGFIQQKNNENIRCPVGYTAKQLIFNSESGFYINSIGRKINKKHNDFSEYLNYIIDLNNIHVKFGKDLNLKGVSEKEILERNSFKFLDSLLNTSDGRLLRLSAREARLFTVLGRQYQSNGGFFVNPINVENGKLEGLIILEENKIKKGLNVMKACL